MTLNSLRVHAIKPGEQGPSSFISTFVLLHVTRTCDLLRVRHIEHQRKSVENTGDT